MQQFYPINSPLINYYFYKAPLTQNGPNVPLAGGFLFFYDDTDHTKMLPTYSDVSNPNLPVLNTNPIQLGAAGECPLFYLNNQLYYIVITDSTGNQGNPVTTISHYDPSNQQEIVLPVNNDSNMIANGQFNYPIEFWKLSSTVGLVTQSSTGVAWGWKFLQDPLTKTENVITINNVTAEGIEGNPINEIQLTSTNIQAGESVKDFVTVLGNVNFMEGQQITISMQLISYLAGNQTVLLLFEKNYGTDGSPNDLFTITSFTITPQRTKYTFVYTIPLNAGKTINENSYCAIHIQGTIGQICDFGTTNVLVEPGVVDKPVYGAPPYIKAVSNILGEATQIEPAGLFQNYSFYTYNNGTIFPYARTGEMYIYPSAAPPIFAVPCDGGAYQVSAYTNNIPNQRLYNVIGTIYGGAGSLEVTNNGNQITFNSIVGAREHSPYTPGNTSFVVVQAQIGLQYEVNVGLLAPNEIQVTWVGNFTINQFSTLVQGTMNISNFGKQNPIAGPMGNYFPYGLEAVPIPASPVVTETVITIGSGSTSPQVNLTFNSNNIVDYYTRAFNSFANSLTQNFLNYAIQSNNSFSPVFNNINQLWFFTVDGVSSTGTQMPLSGGSRTLTIPFLSNLTLEQNLKALIKQIANPFIWTVTVTVIPTASQYFFFSSASTDFYAWYKVDGMGADPVIGGRTGIEVDINSTDSAEVVANKTAVALTTLEFNVPNVGTHLPVIPGAPPLSQWFINL